MYKGKRILALITARGGSKGIPNKNIHDFNGKPLLCWTIEAANASQYIDHTILSTDSDKIAKVATSSGCDVPFLRPAELATDESSSMDVIMHALETLDQHFDYLLLLQPTSPLRTSHHIDQIIENCIDSDVPMMISVTEVKKHPDYFYELDSEGRLKGLNGDKMQRRRQDMHRLYEHNGALYFSHIGFLKEKRSYTCPEARAFIMDSYSSVDIDDETDLEYAQFLMKKRDSSLA